MKTRHIATLAAACLLGGSMAWALETKPAAGGADSKECKQCSGGDREAMMLKKYDANSDGKLDETEKSKMAASHKGREARTLAKYDTNKDGKLDDTESASMKAAKEARHAEFIKKYDKNGDGKLDETESATAKAEWTKSHGK